LIGKRLEIVVDEHAVAAFARPSLQRECDEIAEAAARHRVLARKQPVVGIEADLRPAVHGPRQQHRREAACVEGRDGVGKEQPDVAAVAGARPLECCRNSELATCGQECERVARPALIVEVNGEKAAGVVEQQRIDTSDKITAAVVPDAILATQMGFDHLVGDRNKRLVRALSATNLRLATNTAHPLVRASWSIPAAARFRILPSRGEHIRAAPE
jgi:hypothetical protein